MESADLILISTRPWQLRSALQQMLAQMLKQALGPNRQCPFGAMQQPQRVDHLRAVFNDLNGG